MPPHAAVQLCPPLAVPGGIVLRVTRTDTSGRERGRTDFPPVADPVQAVQLMCRTVVTYTSFMTPLSRTRAGLWVVSRAELHAAVACLANIRSYRRSWTLRNGHILTLAAVPSGAAEQHRKAPVR
ncbi:hypothetical protein [Kitasatospora sp. NPDC059160]|uniref:hypothetical protein n=1 Tax=Kitasatospora sp. NPDC059160 TaxID=3346748 RepID=UPI0036BB4DB8